MDIENPLTKNSIFWICFTCFALVFIIIFFSIGFYCQCKEDKEAKSNAKTPLSQNSDINSNNTPEQQIPLTPY